MNLLLIQAEGAEKMAETAQNFELHTEELISMALHYAPRVILAALTLIIGLMLIKPLVRRMRHLLEKRDVDPSLIPFLSSITKILSYSVLIIAVASMIGIQTTSFITILGAAGLAIGLALQGSLSNFAGGVLILIFKPFKVDEVIESGSVTGTVQEIQIFHTILLTYDRKTVVLPNGTLSNNMIINYSRSETRVVEWIFGISYSNKVEKVRQIILEEIFTDSRVIHELEPYINLSAFGESSVNIKVRALVKQEDYWTFFFEMNEKIKMRFEREGIEIPFPQREIRIVNSK